MNKFKSIIKSIFNSLGYQILKKKENTYFEYPPDFSEEVIDTIEKVKPYTMTSHVRIFELISAIEYVSKHNISGSIVECGVWKGGSMMAVAETLVRLKLSNRRLLLYDTFEGMPPAEIEDKSYRGEEATALLKNSDKSTSRIWAVAQKKEVRSNMSKTGYPQNKIKYIEGRVEETIPSNAPKEIALLRLDTDWYNSTLHELEHLYPRLVSGGILIIDDYGHWKGAKKAVDQYFEKNRIPIFLSRIDYTGRIGVKP